MEPIKVFTTGYEKRDIFGFVENLQRHNIKTLIDVRELPISRKTGFSKSKLTEYLHNSNIKYIHIRELGSPKALRTQLYEDSNYEVFFKGYRKYLKSKIDIVEDLYHELITNELCCIMCYERNPSQCHRTVVAEKIKDIDGNGLIITHI